MEAYIKVGHYWALEENSFKILEEKDVIFGNDLNDAVNKLNNSKEYNPYAPNFLKFFASRFRSAVHGYTGGRVEEYVEPRLRDMPFEKALEIIKNAGHAGVQLVNYETFDKWKKEISGDFYSFGIVNSGLRFIYDPEMVEQRLKEIKNPLVYEPYKPKRKKGFIRQREFEPVIHAMIRRVSDATTMEGNYVRVDIDRYRYNTKVDRSKYLIAMKCLFESIFGKYSYRRLKEFQNLRIIWKRVKPKSAESINVSMVFFDFMQNEATKRRPRNKELKARLDLPV